MLLAAKAWRLRQAARQSLEARDFEGALGLASEAQQAHRTRTGESLRVLSVFLRSAERL